LRSNWVILAGTLLNLRSMKERTARRWLSVDWCHHNMKINKLHSWWPVDMIHTMHKNLNCSLQINKPSEHLSDISLSSHQVLWLNDRRWWQGMML
jgi:hypothetical protein